MSLPTIPTFPIGRQPDIVLAHQKDSFYCATMENSVKELVETIFVYFGNI